MTKKSLMAAVELYLLGRPDVRLIGVFDGRLVGTQLRRVWEKFTFTASIFNPHEKERWHYYGQAFVIEEAVITKGELCKEQKALVADLSAVGTQVILPQSLDFVKTALGPVPQDVDAWVERVEK